MSKASSAANSSSDALAALDKARRARERAEAQEVEALRRARDAGTSWAKIGALYGLTKQGAQQRFKARVERAAVEPEPDRSTAHG